MNDKDFVCFKHVAESQHLTKSAQELFISQAHLSRIISGIEKEIGVELFTRQGRNIYLNESGKAFYQYTLKIMGLYREAIQKAQQIAKRDLFNVTLVTNSGAYMPGLLAYIAEECPDLTIRQLSAPRKTIISMLRTGVVDFAIVSPPLKEIGIESCMIGAETPALIYPQHHWLENRTSVSLNELQNEPFVGVAQGYGARDSLDMACRALEVSPTFILETGDTSSVLNYVQRGLGVSAVAESLIQEDSYYKNHYARITDNIPCILGLSWSSQATFDNSLELFKDTTIKYFQKRFPNHPDSDPSAFEVSRS